MLRTTSWTRLVGLISVSDAIYSDDWLYGAPNDVWTITPEFVNGTATNASTVWFSYSMGVSTSIASSDADGGYGYGVLPTVYLKPGIKVISGNGSDKPYILAN